MIEIKQAICLENLEVTTMSALSNVQCDMVEWEKKQKPNHTVVVQFLKPSERKKMTSLVQESALNLSNSDCEGSLSGKEDGMESSASNNSSSSIMKSHSIDAILGLRRQQQQQSEAALQAQLHNSLVYAAAAGPQFPTAGKDQQQLSAAAAAASELQRHFQNNNSSFLHQQALLKHGRCFLFTNRLFKKDQNTCSWKTNHITKVPLEFPQWKCVAVSSGITDETLW